MTLIPIPALSDNYIWMLHNGRQALVVDPGEASAVLRVLEQQQLQLDCILVTHHHPDHVDGIETLCAHTADQSVRLYGPAHEHIPGPVQPLSDGQQLLWHGLRLQVLDVPGHTAGHIAYYCDRGLDSSGQQQDPLLFCGDTLFSAGCGRLFEGTPAQMLDSLDRLASLPGTTQVCCTHEYTLSNLKFALTVEPGNTMLVTHQQRCQQLRHDQRPTLPSSIALEQAINPFLRVREPSLRAAAQQWQADACTDVEVFAALRSWKNQFK